VGESICKSYPVTQDQKPKLHHSKLGKGLKFPQKKEKEKHI
jgi:hypothetical protein